MRFVCFGPVVGCGWLYGSLDGWMGGLETVARHAESRMRNPNHRVWSIGSAGQFIIIIKSQQTVKLQRKPLGKAIQLFIFIFTGWWSFRWMATEEEEVCYLFECKLNWMWTVPVQFIELYWIQVLIQHLIGFESPVLGLSYFKNVYSSTLSLSLTVSMGDCKI